jgi:hypothetical protein
MDQILGGFHISHSSIGRFSPRAGVIPNRDLTALPGVGRGRAAGLPVRAYLFCVLGLSLRRACLPRAVASLAGRLREPRVRRDRARRHHRGRDAAHRLLVEATAHRIIAVHFHGTPAARHWPTSWRASG